MPISNQQFHQSILAAAYQSNYSTMHLLMKQLPDGCDLDISISGYTNRRNNQLLVHSTKNPIALWLTDRLRRQGFFKEGNKKLLLDMLTLLRESENGQDLFIKAQPTHLLIKSIMY